MDKALENRLRAAINDPIYGDTIVITKIDAKRLLYRLKKENADTKLVYRKDEASAR